MRSHGINGWKTGDKQQNESYHLLHSNLFQEFVFTVEYKDETPDVYLVCAVENLYIQEELANLVNSFNDFFNK